MAQGGNEKRMIFVAFDASVQAAAGAGSQKGLKLLLVKILHRIEHAGLCAALVHTGDEVENFCFFHLVYRSCFGIQNAGLREIIFDNGHIVRTLFG